VRSPDGVAHRRGDPPWRQTCLESGDDPIVCVSRCDDEEIAAGTNTRSSLVGRDLKGYAYITPAQQVQYTHKPVWFIGTSPESDVSVYTYAGLFHSEHNAAPQKSESAASHSRPDNDNRPSLRFLKSRAGD
jgi:hypothetical protein